MKSKYYVPAAVILIILILISQWSTRQKIMNIENELNSLQNNINSISGMVTNQSYLQSQDAALYLIKGITFDDVTVFKTPGVLRTKMLITFDKVPVNGKIHIEYRGTNEHYATSQKDLAGFSYPIDMAALTYEEPQRIQMIEMSPNVYMTEFNFNVNQNYEIALIVNDDQEQIKEMLGVIPVLEWSDPNYVVAVEMQDFSVNSSNSGQFNYKLSLDQPTNFQDLFIGGDLKPLYNFEGIDSPFGDTSEFTKVSYQIDYEGQTIKEGVLTKSPNGKYLWEIEDAAKFEASSDESDPLDVAKFDVVVKCFDANGLVYTYKWGIR